MDRDIWTNQKISFNGIVSPTSWISFDDKSRSAFRIFLTYVLHDTIYLLCIDQMFTNYSRKFQYKNWKIYIYIYSFEKRRTKIIRMKPSAIILSLSFVGALPAILSSSLSRIDSRASIGPSVLVRRVPFGCSRLFWHLHSVCRGYRRDVTRTWITSGIATRADGKRRV